MTGQPTTARSSGAYVYFREGNFEVRVYDDHIAIERWCLPDGEEAELGDKLRLTRDEFGALGRRVGDVR